MTPAQQEIYARSRARATAGWNPGFLDDYEGDDFRIAVLGYRSGLFERMRLAAEIEEGHRSKPLYSRSAEMTMNRFQEPKDWDDNVFRIWGTYKPDTPIVLVPENRCEHFRDLDDFNNAAYWPEYEVEQLKGSEPDIIKGRLYFFEGGQRVEVANAHGLEVLAEDYLREDHGRWAAMRRWLQEYGEVELVREAAA